MYYTLSDLPMIFSFVLIFGLLFGTGFWCAQAIMNKLSMALWKRRHTYYPTLLEDMGEWDGMDYDPNDDYELDPADGSDYANESDDEREEYERASVEEVEHH